MDNNDSWNKFAEQSKFFWGFQQTIALVEIAIFSGWYTLYTSNQPMKMLACGSLLFGIFILFVLYLIIRRASQYLEVLRPNDIVIPKPLFGLRTSQLGRIIPIALMIFNLILIVYTILN
jgi:hypothetical protein